MERNNARCAKFKPVAESRERKKSTERQKAALSRCIIEARRARDGRYDLISCVNCSLVNCQSYSSRELSSPLYIHIYADTQRNHPLSFSPPDVPRDGDGRWPSHGTAPARPWRYSRCPMNALHFHTSPGGQRERPNQII